MSIDSFENVGVVKFYQDKQAYNYWFHREFRLDEDDGDGSLQRMSKIIYTAINSELTEKQRIYFWLYYMEGLTLKEISVAQNVSVSSVSRTIKRARSRMKRVLKYANPRFAHLFEQSDDIKEERHLNTKGEQRYKRAYE